MDPVTERIGELALVPVIKIDDAARAAPLADALVAGGLPCAEITFRTDAAVDAIRTIASHGDLIVGAGTVVAPEQVTQAVDAGARFVVSPGLDEDVVGRCNELSVPVFPGVATPTEMTRALRIGLEIVKLFPAGALGGMSYLRSVAAPFPGLRFMPTGGVSASNLREWLAHPRVFACGGSWMVPADALADGDFDRIEALVREATALVPPQSC
ncbi:MAG: bifunctional 4-hydroxy-2-oxoglutarate aldolase/2-dehydro-3-deoxy-phosphogluconate aldolase [Planctomycetes bacterium]|nr:bifunctional 4-hydroxy-2-oxoglutarate aldolase/2-dehydro-3-deoxy-phosphogluconate aldolase [Planctomycetota bacterium]